MKPPTDAGKAFYATGVFTMDSIDQLNIAKNAAAAFARRELAASMKAKIEAVLMNYAKRIKTASGESKYEELTLDVSREIVNDSIYGAKVVQNDMREYKDKFLFFTLVRVGFDGVAKALHKAAEKEFQEVQDNAEEAFAQLDKILDKEEKNIKGDSVGNADLPVPAEE